MERWDAYDMDFQKDAGVTLLRGEKIPEGRFHLVCGVLVEHADGTWLVMRRAPSKSFGGLWEAAAGGSALAGETPLDCAVGELREETGPFDGGGPGAQRGCPRHFRGVSLPDRRGKGDGFLTAGGDGGLYYFRT